MPRSRDDRSSGGGSRHSPGWRATPHRHPGARRGPRPRSTSVRRDAQFHAAARRL